MKRRPRRAPGQFVLGDIVVVKSWKFRVGGVRSETERRIGKYIGLLDESLGAGVAMYHAVYCPVGGWVFVGIPALSRATAAQERAFRGKWDKLFAAMRGGRA